MGSGEFDGGSSVTWKITHSDGDSGSGNQHGARGKDKHPKGPNGTFVVEVTGQLPREVHCAATRNTKFAARETTRFRVCQLPATRGKDRESKTRRAKGSIRSPGTVS